LSRPRTSAARLRSFRSKGYQTENGSGVGLLENVGKLNMMLRRKMRVASEEIATEGRARQLEVTVAEGPVVRIAFPPATSHTNRSSRSPQNRSPLARNRKFESISLQQGVSCEPNFLEAGRRTILSAKRKADLLSCADTALSGGFAVGTLVSERPPHRSERAQFGHSAPTSGV
jgi:hypothetical protein